MTITGNRFGQGYNPKSGLYGPSPTTPVTGAPAGHASVTRHQGTRALPGLRGLAVAVLSWPDRRGGPCAVIFNGEPVWPARRAPGLAKQGPDRACRPSAWPSAGPRGPAGWGRCARVVVPGP
jgi:hypothetical protein